MRQSRAVVPTTEYIQSLYNNGDEEALRALNETLGKRSNERLRQLEKADFDTTAAYKRATDFIKKSEYGKNNRFSRSKKIGIDELYDQVKQEANFLRWRTSTIAGELKRREEIYRSLFVQRIDEETGDIVNPPLDLPSGVTDIDAFKKKFLDFLDTKSWETIKKHIYQSNILNEAGEAIAAGASIEDLNEAMQRYFDGEVNPETGKKDDLLTIWDNWSKVT